MRLTTSAIDAEMCERFVSAASRACPAPVNEVAAKVQSQPPEWDALANSFASLSSAFAWGSIWLATVAIIAAAGWGYIVKRWAEDEARKAAAESVQKHMEKWLAEEAPQIIRKNVELLNNTSLGQNDDAEAADEMGKEAG